MSKKPGSNSKNNLVSQETRQKVELKAMKKLDVTHLKQNINSLRDQLKHLVNENILIEKNIQKNTENFMNQSYDLEKIAKIQQEELIELENKHKMLKNTFKEAEMKKKAELTAEIQELVVKKQFERDQLKKILQTLSKKVEHIKKFKQRQTQYLLTIAKLEQRQQYLKFSHSKDIEKLKSTYQNKRQQIKQITNKQIQHIQLTEVSKIRQKLTKEQQIKKENQIIQQEIKLCEEEKIVVQNQFKLLGEEIKINAEDDSKIMLGTQATQTYQRSLRVIKLQGKIAKLKEFLTEEMKRFDDQLKIIDKIYDQQEKNTSQKIQKLKNTLTLKERDYKKVKACSQMVLNQRSSLESYLLQIFYENSELDNKKPSNVNEILRKLFIKINSKKTPISYKNYVNFN